MTDHHHHHQQHDHDHNHHHNNNNDHYDHDHNVTTIDTTSSNNQQQSFLQQSSSKQQQQQQQQSQSQQIQNYLDHYYHENTPEMYNQQLIINKLRKALLLILFFLMIEIIGGYIAQSLAIWSDAAHLLADMAAIMVALLAAHLGTFPISDKHTFGLKRVESLAALFSTMSLLCISIGLAYEAIRRIYLSIVIEHNNNDDNNNNDSSSPSNNEIDDNNTDTTTHVVNGKIMSIIAFIGVLVNIILAYVLGEHHVHLPSDSNECSHHHHDHNHGHDHGHNHSDHNDATTTTTKEPSSSTTTNTCSSHDHSHGHEHNHHNDDHHNEGDHHDHNTTTTTTPTESTPLLVSSSSTAAKSRPQDSSETSNQPSKWKIPFSPQNINLQAAYLHVLGDLAQSATVFIAGVIIWIIPSLTIVDPICTLLFCILVFYSAYGVCCTSIAVLLQQVPSHLNYYHIRDRIAMVQYVQDVHDLHIWSISHRVPALTVHVSITYPINDTTNSSNNDNTTTTTTEQHIHDMVLEKIYEIVKCEFNIIHATIQIQSANSNCITCVDRLCRPCLDDDNNNNINNINNAATNDSETSIIV